MTFNDSWGYTPIDRHYKDGWETVGMLIQCAAGGGNLLLNIGPAPDGSIPAESVRVLREVTHWMAANGEAIYGSERVAAEWMPIGQFTAKGSTMYLHIRNWPGPTAVVGGLTNRVKSARLLASGEPVRFEQTENRLLLQGLPIEPPDPFATVIALEVDGTPLQRLGAGCVIL
jgi:alpha-L-fucosidase